MSTPIGVYQGIRASGAQSRLVQRRKDLHQAVGHAIEELYPDRLADHYEELAYHFAQGEVSPEAMNYSVLAGDHAAHTFANAEASQHYARAIEAAPDAEEALRLSKEIGDPKLLAQTLCYSGALLQWRADFGRSLAYHHEAAEHAQRAHAGFLFGMAAFFIGHANTAKGEYEEALRWYRRLSDYAHAAGDKVWMARAPNIIGGVHLELFDLDEAIRLCLEGDEVAQRVYPWPEPRGHSLLKVGLARLQQGEHGPAEEFFRRAWALLETDIWVRGEGEILRKQLPQCLQGFSVELDLLLQGGELFGQIHRVIQRQEQDIGDQRHRSRLGGNARQQRNRLKILERRREIVLAGRDTVEAEVTS